MEKVEWITPIRRRWNNKFKPNQVRVRKTVLHYAANNNAECTDVIFYGTSSLMITNGDYIKVGVSAKRIYFDVGNRESGYKMTKGYKEQRYIRVRGWHERFIGIHDLKFDGGANA